MKDIQEISNEDLLTLYKVVKEYITYLEQQEKNVSEIGDKDAK